MGAAGTAPPEPLPVDAVNFVRAESDTYFDSLVSSAGGLGRWHHIRCAGSGRLGDHQLRSAIPICAESDPDHGWVELHRAALTRPGPESLDGSWTFPALDQLR